MATAIEEQDIDAELQAALEEEQRKREEARLALAQAEAQGTPEAQARERAANAMAAAESQGMGIRDMPVDGFIEPAAAPAAPAGGLLPNYSPEDIANRGGNISVGGFQPGVVRLGPLSETPEERLAVKDQEALARVRSRDVPGFSTTIGLAGRDWSAGGAQPGPNSDTQSRRLFGRNEFQRLVSEGVSPADAYARVAPDLLSGDTAAISRAFAPSRRTAPEPPAGTATVRINRDPETGEAFSRSILNPSGTVHSTTRVAPPAAPATGPAKSKVKQANDLARKNPSWTRKQIIDAVNQGR